MKRPSLRVFSPGQLGPALLGVAIGLLFSWLAFRQMEWESVVGALAAATWGGFGVAVLFKFGSDFVRAIRWRCLWTEHRVPVTRLYVVETVGVGLNNLAPVHAFDEPLIIALLTIRDRLPAGPIVATLIMARVLDLACTVSVAVLAVFLLPELLELAWAMALTGAALVVALLVIFNLRWLLTRIPILARVPIAASLSASIADLRQRPGRLAVGFFLTVAYWAMLGPAAFFLGRSMGIDLPIQQMTAVVLGTIFFSTAVPSLPGGLGTFEWAVITLLGFWGVDREAALGFALLLHAVIYVPSILVAVIALPYEGVGSVAALRRLLARAPDSVAVPAEVGETARRGPDRSE